MRKIRMWGETLLNCHSILSLARVTASTEIYRLQFKEILPTFERFYDKALNSQYEWFTVELPEESWQFLKNRTQAEYFGHGEPKEFQMAMLRMLKTLIG